MITYRAMVRFNHDLPPAGYVTPTRSFVLGEPSRGVVYGCKIRLSDDQPIISGYEGWAEVGVVSDLDPRSTLNFPIAIWGGDVIAYVDSFVSVIGEPQPVEVFETGG